MQHRYFSLLIVSFSILTAINNVQAKDVEEKGYIDLDINVSVGNPEASRHVIIENNKEVYYIKLGQSDTPCPPPTLENPYCEQPDKEVDSSYRVQLDVFTKGGGDLTFKYRFKTYDGNGPGNDFVDIMVDFPPYFTYPTFIEENWRSPHSEKGRLWDSGEKIFTMNLDKWKEDQNARVRLYFLLSADGHGDQSILEIYDLKVIGCDVIPLQPITDPGAIEFENGNNINTDRLNALTKKGLSCMEHLTRSLGGNFTLTSAYRPASYQEHLHNVWETKEDLLISIQPKEYCAAIQNETDKEMSKHGLITEPAEGNPYAPHSRGNAIDAVIQGLPAPHTVDTIAEECGMYRRMPEADPVHYEPKQRFFEYLWEQLFYD